MNFWPILFYSAEGAAAGEPATPSATTPPAAEPSPPPAAVTEGGSGAPQSDPPSPRAEVAPGNGGPASATSPDWREKRIAVLTGKLKEAQEELARQALGKEDKTANPSPPDMQAEIERLAKARAEQIAAEREYTKQCNEVVDSGRKTFGAENFNARVEALKALADVTDQKSVSAYTTFIQSAIETGAADKILYQLGADLNQAEKIMNLSPVKMALALAKLATQPEPAAPSSAPKPITPIGGKGQAHTDIDPADPERSDGLDTATWMKRREAELERRRKSEEAA